MKEMSTAKNDNGWVVECCRSLGIPKNHGSVGVTNLLSSDTQLRQLFLHKRIPEKAWSDSAIQRCLWTLSSLDTNDDTRNRRWCGVGEREGRVYSNLVRQRHYGMSHGIGRSGDIGEAQPKAVGSSVMARLTLSLLLDVVRRGCGLDSRAVAKDGILLPLCTGMTMSLVLCALRDRNRNTATACTINDNAIKTETGKPVVLWCRIDQKSCLKAIFTAGLAVVVIPTVIINDTVTTDLEALEDALTNKHGVVAVVSTASCFAPREPDRLDRIAKLCCKHDVPHVVNDAYGLQCTSTCKLLNRAIAVGGRIDAVVFSSDKNFMVPVGGACVLSPDPSLIKSIGKTYAGRASAAPVLDLFITLLSMGLEGYKNILEERKRLLPKFQARFEDVAKSYGGRLLCCPENTISFAITLDSLSTITEETLDQNMITELGSMLFTRCVSGTRVVARRQTKSINGHLFYGYGSSTDDYPHTYLTAACAIGLQEDEMNDFFQRLEKTLKAYQKKLTKKMQKISTEI